MELLPGEIIALIGSYLDVFSAVRFSRTCQRVHAFVITNRDVIARQMRSRCDEIRAIKYDVYPRDISDDDDFGNYCGVREIRGRIVGSIACVTFTRRVDPISGRPIQRGADDIIIFSDKLQMTGSKYDIDSDNDSDCDIDDIRDLVYCCLNELLSHNMQTDVIYTTYALEAVEITRDDIIRASLDDIIARPRKYNDVYIYSKSPGIVDGELGWFP